MIDADRSVAAQTGLTQRDVANSVLLSLTGSGSTTTNFWLNPKNGVSYQVVVQTPQYRVASLDEVYRTPVALAGTLTAQASPQLLSNLASFQRTVTPLSLTSIASGGSLVAPAVSARAEAPLTDENSPVIVPSDDPPASDMRSPGPSPLPPARLSATSSSSIDA